MTECLQPQVFLPTLAKLHVKQPDDIDPRDIATNWLRAFSEAVESGNIGAVVDLFVEDGFWRDTLALTWEFRTFHGVSRIFTFLKARLAVTKLAAIRLSEHKDRKPSIYKLNDPDLIWVQGLFDFETAIGLGSGVFRVVPTPNGQWKAHVIYTNLESLRGMPYKVGPLRDHNPNHGQWLDDRIRELSFEDSDPTVLIIGAGQSGLDVAVRLKNLDVSALVVEKNARIGDNWRNRYQALCLHDPVWYNHMPYLTFPPTWPVYTPAHKLADWLEFYAHSMELNVWTSTVIEKLERDETRDGWVVRLTTPHGLMRTMKPKYIVFAFGFAGNQPNIPNIPGMNGFKGKIVHSTAFRTAADFIGSKAVVVGACTSAHDIAQDLQSHGADVTLVQRSSTCVVSVKKGVPAFYKGLYREGGPPLDVADLISASYPLHVLKLMHQLIMKQVMEEDRETIEGLKRVGFMTNYGEDDSGFVMLARTRGGGYYLDVGASQLIIDGKIKLKKGTVESFTADSLVFEDGSTVKADVVVFATGLGDARESARQLLGDELTAAIPPIWGLTEEGELRTVWRNCGVTNLYFMTGNLALCRFHSTHVALQIKAKEKGLYTAPYTE